MTSVLWHSNPQESSEHCSLTETAEGHRLSGTAVIPIEMRPVLIRYVVDTDEGWRTRSVEVMIGEEGRDGLILLSADSEGAWSVAGEPAPQLDGCLDIDLAWSPSTNTLPIRRLGLEVGGSASVDAAWIRLPQFDVRPATQQYRRLDERRWRYSSGAFEAILEVDDEGLVLSYGPGIWHAIAHSSWSLG